ncbi:glycosyltransferase family 2 protein [Glycomyces salinus]|uniref:glycosyltransferase family 2 protein n=1 Tax=Glycomyces salinus TaxID=980294 RepID=UPI0018EE1E46|nr:glycosyltransferase family 2 protein [Glycomyces salinus]
MPPETVLAHTAATADRHCPDSLVDVMRQSGATVAFRTALRTCSPLAVEAIARIAAPGLSVEELIAAARGGGTDTPEGFDPDYASALAGVLHSHGDHESCRSLYAMAARHAAGPLDPEHLAWYARSELRRVGNVDRLADELHRLPPVERLAIEADAAHPGLGGDSSAWLAKFAELTGMSGLALDGEAEGAYLDRLTAGPVRPVKSNVKISIIMTCHRPGPELETAVRSVIAQSWINWELLLVDDCSEPEFHPVLAEVTALDPRVRLLILPRNVGTYGARNRALAECAGSIVTGLDSDDWAHPRWLERQSKPLLRDESLVMSVSNAVRVLPDLTVTRSTRSVTGPRSTSIMFRAWPVRKRMGYFDSVRKGADTEFRMRFAAVFGNRAIARLRDESLTLVRLSEETLTSSEFGMGWLHPSRWAYQSAQKQWHRRIRARKTDPFVPAAAPERPFFAPALVRGNGEAPRRFDEILVADCRAESARLTAILDRATAAAAGGRTVGLLHLESLHRPCTEIRPIHPAVIDALQEHRIAFVTLLDPVETDRLTVAEASLWEGRESEYCLTVSGSVDILSDEVDAVPCIEPATVPEPAANARRLPHLEPRQRLKRFLPGRRKRAAAALSGSAALLAAVSWALIGPSAAIFALAHASLLGLSLLYSSRGYRRLMVALDRKSA